MCCCSPELAEKELLTAIRKGELTASVNPDTGFVYFRDGSGLCATSDTAYTSSSSSSLASAQSAAQLHAYLSQTIQLSARLQDMHRAALLSTKYIVKNTASRHLGMGGIAGMGMDMRMGMGMGGMDYNPMDLS